METADFFETLVYIYLTTRRHIPEGNKAHSCYSENFKSEKVMEYRTDFVQEQAKKKLRGL